MRGTSAEADPGGPDQGRNGERQPYQICNGAADADQQARARSPAGPQEYGCDAAHHATRRRRYWKTTPFGTGMNERHRIIIAPALPGALSAVPSSNAPQAI